MEIKAVKDKVFAAEVKEREFTKAGIELIESEFSEELPLKKCVVVSVGPECTTVKVGNKVAINPNYARKFSYIAEDYFLLRENEIEGIYDWEESTVH